MFKLTSKLYAPDGDQGGSPQGGGDQPDKGGDPKTNEVNEKLAYLDTELKKVIKDRDELKSKVREYDEKESLKAGEYQKLIDNLKTEKTELEKQLNEYKPYAERYKSYEQKRVDAIKAELADRWKPEFDGLGLEPLEAIAAITKLTPAPKVDGGDGKSPALAELTEDEKAEAKRMFQYSSDPYEQFKKFKAKLTPKK